MFYERYLENGEWKDHDFTFNMNIPHQIEYYIIYNKLIDLGGEAVIDFNLTLSVQGNLYPWSHYL